MNKPKFRAWDKITQRIYEVYGWNTSTNEIYICSLPNSAFEDGLLHTTHVITRPLDNFILMQYTGLKDKNGVEIFEGYIVKRKYESVTCDAEHYSHHVVFQDKTGAWRIMHPNKRLSNIVDIKNQIEVRGNIHANPELLNEVE